jgi:hypothetical protein
MKKAEIHEILPMTRVIQTGENNVIAINGHRTVNKFCNVKMQFCNFVMWLRIHLSLN